MSNWCEKDHIQVDLYVLYIDRARSNQKWKFVIRNYNGELLLNVQCSTTGYKFKVANGYFFCAFKPAMDSMELKIHFKNDNNYARIKEYSLKAKPIDRI